MTGTEITVMVLDFIILFIFFYFLINNLQTMQMRGFVKSLVIVFVVWVLAKLLSMEMTVTVIGTILSYVVLLVVILFPEEFRKMLDRFGRKRSFYWSVDRLIGKEERRAVAEAMMEMSRERVGFLLVIAKGSGLEEELESGEYIGEVRITKEMIRSLWRDGGKYNKGAMIIKDNLILTVNSMLPIGRRDDLIKAGAGSRHLAALGVTYANDCVALVVSATTGKITIANKNGKDLDYHYSLDTREHDIRNGIDVNELERRIEESLVGKPVKEVKDGESKKLTREEREKQMKKKREEKQKKREQRKKEQQERRKKGKKTGGTRRKKKEESEGEVSRGFGGYDL